jgi:hypothetical protein
MTTGLQVSGWCSTGHHGEACPHLFEALTLPDPAKPGTFYTTKRRVCECPCHESKASV